jgi:hypothetical protein
MMQPFDQLLNATFLALDVGVHATVRTIPDPASDTQLARLIAHPGSKEDALHAAVYADVPRRLGHQTTLMSGASSAFMPTTL